MTRLLAVWLLLGVGAACSEEAKEETPVFVVHSSDWLPRMQIALAEESALYPAAANQSRYAVQILGVKISEPERDGVRFLVDVTMIHQESRCMAVNEFGLSGEAGTIALKATKEAAFR